MNNSKSKMFSNNFQFQSEIVNNCFENLTEENAVKRPSEHSNHINWLLGHILHCRYMLANTIGVNSESPFKETYWKNIENEDYPKIEEIKSDFTAISGQLINKLNSLTDEEITAKEDPKKPSLEDIISFFVYHEAYHIGQIGYARKLLGMNTLKSN